MGVTAGEVLGVRAPGSAETVRLPIMLLDTSGNPVTGVAFDAAGVTVQLAKEGDSAFAAWATVVGNAFATANWDEIGYGNYDLILRGSVAGEAAVLNTQGHLRVYVKFTATRGDTFLFKVNPADAARDDAWTDAKAVYLDAAVTSRSTLTAQQVWEYGTRTLSAFGTLIADLWGYATRTLTSGGSLTAQQTRDALKLAPSAGAAAAGSIDDQLADILAEAGTCGAIGLTATGPLIVNGELVVEAPRGDTYTLRVTAEEDLSAYDAFVFTVKSCEYRQDADDANALFQVSGSIAVDGLTLTFDLTSADTEAAELDVWYDCDVEASTTGRTAVKTALRGRYRSTLDVTRGAATP